MAEKQERSDKELVIRRDGSVVFVTLNRPESLNALSLEMIRLLSAGLRRWENDDTVRAIFITGAGNRAFCAGGDVKAVYAVGMDVRRGEGDDRVPDLYFGEEYRLNRQLFHYPKPVFAFMDGIVMGGGYGIAGPCRYKIVTENTVFAMPEVGIGFFPDVGSAWFMNRSPGHMGAFLCVTGERIGASDMIYGCFSTNFVPHAQMQDCINDLKTAVEKNLPADKILETYKHNPGPQGIVKENQPLLDRCFVFNTVEEILDALEKERDPWAVSLHKLMTTRSPLSMKIALAHLRSTKNMTFDQVTAQDYVLAQHFMKRQDFFEGVRAAVVEKDRMPRWNPATLADVTPEILDEYFQPTGRALEELAA